MDKELDLAVTCYGKVKPLKYDLVLLPWGATEPHNLHLPYLTDCILSHDIALDAAKLAKTHYGIRCMVMPYVIAGSQNPGQRELDFCIHYRYETQKAILNDLVASLYAQGYRTKKNGWANQYNKESVRPNNRSPSIQILRYPMRYPHAKSSHPPANWTNHNVPHRKKKTDDRHISS